MFLDFPHFHTREANPNAYGASLSSQLLTNFVPSTNVLFEKFVILFILCVDLSLVLDLLKACLGQAPKPRNFEDFQI